MREKLEKNVEMNSQATDLLDKFRNVISNFSSFNSPLSSPVKDETENVEDEQYSSPEQEEHSSDEKGDRSPDMKSLLMAKLNEGRAKAKPVQFSIKKTISVDSQILNFGNFYPEKLLGSILMVTNNSDQEQIV